MYFKTKAIVISSIKYADSSLIVKCFTQDKGIQTYLLQGILSAKRTSLKAALFQPFMQLEIVASYKNMGTLERIKEARVIHTYDSLYTNVYKSSVAMFLSEICSFVCTMEQSDPDLYHFMEQKIQFFDKNEFIANFHLKFLTDLTRFLGFYPDMTTINSSFFDLGEGMFSDFDQAKYTISGKELELFKKIITVNYIDLQNIKTTKTDRNALLNSLIKYYEWHFPGFRKIKSLEVLQVLF